MEFRFLRTLPTSNSLLLMSFTTRERPMMMTASAANRTSLNRSRAASRSIGSGISCSVGHQRWRRMAVSQAVTAMAAPTNDAMMSAAVVMSLFPDGLGAEDGGDDDQ